MSSRGGRWINDLVVGWCIDHRSCRTCDMTLRQGCGRFSGWLRLLLCVHVKGSPANLAIYHRMTVTVGPIALDVHVTLPCRPQQAQLIDTAAPPRVLAPLQPQFTLAAAGSTIWAAGESFGGPACQCSG